MPFKLEFPRWVWNTITVIYFIYVAFEVFFRSGDLIGEGINFTVYLLIVRLLNLKTNRDYFQLYILSFINLLSSSILTESVSFAIPFLLYIIIATWTLTLYNLKAQYEESLGNNPENKVDFYKSRKIITRKFLLATSILSLILIISSSVIFFIFPRMSLGFFYKKIGSRKSMAGFSEEIDLGSIGSIMTNSTIVMRVETQSGHLNKDFLNKVYWRGTAFDSYDGRRWSHSSNKRDKKLIDVLTGKIELTNVSSGSDLFRQKIFLEPMETRIVFAADEMKIIRWEKLKIERFIRKEIGVEVDPYLTSYFISDLASDQNYFAYSDLNSKTGYQYSAETVEYPQDLPYLKLPYRDLRTSNLVDEITRGLTNDYEKAKAMEGYLRDNFRYSATDINIESERPLEVFLFEKRKGHCELFSTAMSIMMRYAGIPSRNVVGFKGGNINDVGNYIVVRQSDAHSWVEGFIAGNGWMRFEPTPSSQDAIMFATRKFGAFAKYYDYLKLRWYKYVIDYDLRAQARYARLFFAGVSKYFKTTAKVEKKTALSERLRKGAGDIWKQIVSFVLILAVIALLYFRFVSRRNKKYKSRENRGSSFEFYARMLKILSRKGMHKQKAYTPLEFSNEILTTKGEKFNAVSSITKHYYIVRFGGRRLSEKAGESINRDIERLKSL